MANGMSAPIDTATLGRGRLGVPIDLLLPCANLSDAYVFNSSFIHASIHPYIHISSPPVRPGPSNKKLARPRLYHAGNVPTLES